MLVCADWFGVWILLVSDCCVGSCFGFRLLLVPFLYFRWFDFRYFGFGCLVLFVWFGWFSGVTGLVVCVFRFDVGVWFIALLRVCCDVGFCVFAVLAWLVGLLYCGLVCLGLG